MCIAASCMRLEPSVFDTSQNTEALAASLAIGWRVATPAFNPAAGYYSSAQTISITTATTGAKIYFTDDGSIPSSSATLYSTPFHIWSAAGKTIQAIGTKSGMPDSSIASGVFGYSTLKTGQALCYDQVGTVISCAGTKQDGELQLGVPRSFTGPAAHAIYTSDYTTTDNATGLVWKSCSQGLSGPACATGTAQTLTWANADSDPTWGCNSLNSANSGNGYAGIKTWRVPTRMEFETLVDHNASAAPWSFAAAFPATVSSMYWTSTAYQPSATKVWTLNFFTGFFGGNLKTNAYNVRCISGSPANPTYNYTDNGDGTIKDNGSGLIWQKCSMGQNNDTACSGAATTATLTPAMTYCNSLGLAGKSWRLPNIQELKTLVDTTTSASVKINGTAFPSTPANSYHSSTTWNPAGGTNNWQIYLGDGVVDSTGKTNAYNVRCVSGP